MTVHASKGLEFSTVFMVGMEEGLFPHTQSMMDLSELEEERRLCYVAITRAKEKVFLTNATQRLYFGQVQSNLPSRFLSEIPEELTEIIGKPRKSGFNRSVGRYGGTSTTTDDFLDTTEFDRINFNWD